MVLAFCRRGLVIPICLYLLVGRYMKERNSGLKRRNESLIISRDLHRETTPTLKIVQVRTQANIISNSKKDSSLKGDIKHKYEIGTLLLEFMIERKLIHIENITADDKKVVVKKTGKGYRESNLFAVCDFDLSLIPIKMNLPMVCKPIDWKPITEVLDDYRDPFF